MLFSECNSSPATKHILNLPLYLLKPHISAGFTLKVVEQSSYGNKLLPTLRIRTMIQLLLVHRRIEMLIECGQSVEFPMTQVALPVITVVSTGIRLVLNVVILVPFKQLPCNDALGVTTANKFVDSLAIEAYSTLAGAGFKVVGSTSGRSKSGVAERTEDVLTAVNLRIQVLQAKSEFNYNVGRYRRPYHLEVVRSIETPVTGVTVVFVMGLGPHMLFSSTFRMEHLCASLTWPCWSPMVHCIHVLIR